ncbi:hypothetical protein NUW58_g10704 [Xylaria curta]|uniref:Uncharacterized protein n=1 Tax=Xylaria curta TaxID=42375 RepID=A0ACC1MIA4_9PEZI|nr:hypothetical protein NUW58_g10704 [Xylaria curta]
MTDGRFVEQMKRWMRTGLRFRLTCVFSDPGLRVFWRTTPYMCRKMVEGLYNPILTLIWFYSFFKVLRTNPLVAMAIALYYLYGHVKGLLAFAREFPYCRRKLWAAFLVDKVSLISDWYCWCTLFTENWASRAGIDSKDENVWERHLDLDE